MKQLVSGMLVLLLILTSLTAFSEQTSRGDMGARVTELQMTLNTLGYNEIQPDGDFGPKTEVALRNYQKQSGLPETGRVDALTQLRLYNDSSIQTQTMELRFSDVAMVPEVDDGIHSYMYIPGDCTWEEANISALDMGGHLLTIDSQEEYVVVQSGILRKGMMDTAFWIGARRDRHSGHKPYSFYWIGDEGVPYLHPIDVEELMGNCSPWAVGRPAYQSASGEQMLYVRLVYSNEESRWVWEDTLGTPEAGRANGYIVEFDDMGPDDSRTTGLPTGNLQVEAFPGFRLEILGLEGNSVLSRVNTQSACNIKYNFRDARTNELLFSVFDYVESGMRNRLIRNTIPEADYRKLPVSFIIEGILYSRSSDRTSYPQNNTDYIPGQDTAHTDWVVCDRYKDVSNASIPVRPAKKKGKTKSSESNGTYPTIIMPSPNLGPNVKIDIYDENGNYITSIKPGDVPKLPQGKYQYVINNGPSKVNQTFTVPSKEPIFVQPKALTQLEGVLIDSQTGQILPFVTVSLEIQGQTYTATTDANGIFAFTGIPDAKGKLTYNDHGVVTQMIVQGGGSVKFSGEQAVYTEFYGYEVIDSNMLLQQYSEFLTKAQQGVFGPEELYYWFKGRGAYIVVEENINSVYPDGSGRTSYVFEKGTVLDIGYDISQVWIDAFLNGLVVDDALWAQVMDIINSHMTLTNATGVIRRRVKICGYVSKDSIATNNAFFDQVFTGWSDWKIGELTSFAYEDRPEKPIPTKKKHSSSHHSHDDSSDDDDGSHEDYHRYDDDYDDRDYDDHDYYDRDYGDHDYGDDEWY